MKGEAGEPVHEGRAAAWGLLRPQGLRGPRCPPRKGTGHAFGEAGRACPHGGFRVRSCLTGPLVLNDRPQREVSCLFFFF